MSNNLWFWLSALSFVITAILSTYFEWVMGFALVSVFYWGYFTRAINEKETKHGRTN